MKEAFLSYSRRDADAVQQLTTQLDRLGVSFWMDQRDIPVSVPWFDEVREAIRGAELFVVCESSAWHESDACNIELITAEDFGKRVVTIDVLSSAAASSAATVAGAVAGLSELDRAHTDLLVRSAAWDRAGRKPDDLAGGALLRRLRRVQAAESHALTQVARDFLTTGTRRNRRRQFLKVLGVPVLALAMIIATIFMGAQREQERRFAESAKGFTEVASVHRWNDMEPYTGLRAAGELIDSGNKGFMALTVLQQALDIAVPDQSADRAGADIVGFRAGRVPLEPVVVTGDGQLSPGGAGWNTAVSTVSTSDDGRVAVASTPEGPSAVIDGAPVRSPCAGTFPASSASGKTVATVDGGQACVWNPLTGDTRLWQTAGGAASALAVTDRFVVAGFSSGELKVFTLEGAQIVADRGAPVTRIVSASDGTRIAVTREGTGQVEVRTAETGALHRIVPAAAPVRAVRFSPDSRTLAVGFGTTVQLTDVATGAVKLRLRGGAGTVRELAWSDDGKRIWSISDAHRVTGWTWRLGSRVFDDPTTWFVAVSALGPDGRVLAVTRSGALVAVDPRGSSTTPVAQTTASKVIAASVTDDHGVVALATHGQVTFFDLRSRTERTATVDGCAPTSTAFAPDGSRLLVVCQGRELLSLDPGSGRTIDRVTPRGGATAVAITRAGEVYVSNISGSVYQTDLSLRHLREMRPLRGITVNTWRQITVSGNGDTMLLTGDGTGRIGRTMVGNRGSDGNWSWYAVDFPTKQGLQARAAVVNANGTLAAVGLSDGTVHYWLPKDSNPGRTYTEVSGAVRGLALTASDEGVVAVTRDGVVDVLPGCPSCGDVTTLAAQAKQRVANAKNMGLMAK